MTALPNEKLIAYADHLSDNSGIFDFIPVKEESQAHVIEIGDGSILMAKGDPDF